MCQSFLYDGVYGNVVLLYPLEFRRCQEAFHFMRPRYDPKGLWRAQVEDAMNEAPGTVVGRRVQVRKGAYLRFTKQ